MPRLQTTMLGASKVLNSMPWSLGPERGTEVAGPLAVVVSGGAQIEKGRLTSVSTEASWF